MNKSNLLYAAAGILAGFIIGFIFANAANHGARRQPPATSARAAAPEKTAAVNSAGARENAQTLSENEIREAIAKADARADDTELQKKFGLALYRYANQQRDSRYLSDAVRFLKRAHEAESKDMAVTISLGNALFDLGQLGDAARFSEARTYYQKVLESKPDDVNVRTDLGLTYYFGTPSDPASAIREYRKSLMIDPRHELTLQNMATALIKTGARSEARKTIETLRSVNPSNPALSDLEALLAQGAIKSEE